MTKAKVGGYNWKRDVCQARRDLAIALKHLEHQKARLAEGYTERALTCAWAAESSIKGALLMMERLAGFHPNRLEER